MNRDTNVKVVLGALAALACAEAAQAGLIFRRGNRRTNDCPTGSGYGYSGGMSGGQYAYTPMSGGQYAYTPMYGGPVGTASGYVDPFAAATGPVAADKARVRIHVPSADTRLWFNNQMVQTGGVDRVFDLPVTAGQSLKYTVTAQWMKDGRDTIAKKDVEVKAGQEVEVTISESDAGTPANTEKLPVTPPNPADANQPKPINP